MPRYKIHVDKKGHISKDQARLKHDIRYNNNMSFLNNKEDTTHN